MILSYKQQSPLQISEYYQMSDWADLIDKDYIHLERILITNQNGENIIFAQIYVYKLIATYTQLYIPRAPIIYTEQLKQTQIQEFWDNLAAIAQQYNAIFTLIEPTNDIYNNYNLLFDNYTQNSQVERLPHQTQILDLSLSESDLLQNMHSKMRYNIKLAQKKGLEIKNINKNNPEFDKYFDIFFNLMQETAKRGDFAIHSKKHYENLLEKSLDNIKLSLIIAEYEEKVLAANIILDTPAQRIYLHGASSNQYRNLMAPPLLQWQAIIEAKNLGKKIYDFWGVSDTKKSWQGISRFKKQFGGKTITYPNSRIVIHKKFIFILYKIFRKLRGKFI